MRGTAISKLTVATQSWPCGSNCRDLAEVVSFEQGSYANYDFKSWCEVSQFRRQFEPDGHDWVATVNFDIAVPRIIRLLFYDRLPRSEVKFNRRNIFARDRNR